MRQALTTVYLSCSLGIDNHRCLEAIAMAADPDFELRERVRSRYAAAARAVRSRESAASVGCCGGPERDAGDGTSPEHGGGDGSTSEREAGCCSASTALDEADCFGGPLYGAGETDGLPAEAVQASLGCGNPLAVAELRAGERVLDLGSGGGIDVLLSARRVGTNGFAYGVDMTDDMLELARANAALAGARNVEFRKGQIEDLPLPDGSVDVVISNCVINLSTNKPAVLAEMFRVLVPGGRIGISDVVAEDHISPADRAAAGTYVGCIAGALTRSEYLAGLRSAGFADVSVTFTAQAAPGMHAANIRAVKPTASADDRA
jgi:arsenite methyltransferase